MYIINELWILIKSFLIHNIKIHGTHLKNDENHKLMKQQKNF